ncbi:DUF4376 domain-containing protein [Azospirillum sp.]|uniref:DUF4376 domain-containing protein n=1 Tax=Azospirillum sp. TaxID=34012 RepID=UPI002D5BEAE8|nr:DUF4376 domain-containing protein [Azospirillum sp.]HYF88965.1 DUF4376 domain-containing protein [Azospirillum sp.]
MPIQRPAAIVMGGVVIQEVVAPVGIVYGAEDAAIQWPALIWDHWTPADWAAMCPDWTVLPLIDEPPTVAGKRAERLPMEEWTIGADAVTVTYRMVDLPQAEVEAAKAATWERIKAERDRRTSGGGFRVMVDGSPCWFHSDTLSRSQHMGMFLMGASLPAGIMWKTMSGAFVEMTPAIATAVFYAAAASDQAIFGAAEAHKAAMLESPDPAAYDFSAGWPVIYGEEAA